MVLPFSRNSIISIIALTAIAAVLSIISYQFSTYNAKEILNIASDDVRSNATIQSHDLLTIIEQELDKVSAILKALASAPAIHNNAIERCRDIINLRQETTSDI